METAKSNKLDKMYSQAMDALRLHHFDEAISLLDEAARQGSLAAILRIAGVYYYGVGTEPNRDKAIEYLLLAGNNARALVNLGTIYYEMEATEENTRKAWKYYERASDIESRYAFYLGRLYFEKRVEEADDLPLIEEAKNYFDEAFEIGGEPISGLYLWKIYQMQGAQDKGKEYLSEVGRRLKVMDSPREYNNAAAALCSFGEYEMALPYIETCLSMVDNIDEHPAYYDTREKILQGLEINK